MKSILNPTKLILLLATVALLGCAKQQDSYSQTIASVDGISDGELTYLQGEKIITLTSLTPSELQYPHIDDGSVTILVTDASGKSTFDEVPSKYINLDATIEVSRNVFQDYFPGEWSAMKGQKYTTLYIKSKKDEEIFYMKCVYTNTDKEIAKYSEDY